MCPAQRPAPSGRSERPKELSRTQEMLQVLPSPQNRPTSPHAQPQTQREGTPFAQIDCNAQIGQGTPPAPLHLLLCWDLRSRQQPAQTTLQLTAPQPPGSWARPTGPIQQPSPQRGSEVTQRSYWCASCPKGDTMTHPRLTSCRARQVCRAQVCDGPRTACLA